MNLRNKTNKSTIINSDMIKIVVASYYRYRLRYYYVCTEYKSWDVCASNEKYLTEMEVKISYSDLIADAKKTKAYGKLKHDYYSGVCKSKYVTVPNYFYYVRETKLKIRPVTDIKIKSFLDSVPKYG